MVTLIDSTVRVTIRHSDSAPIASEVATAWVNRDEATGAERLAKPTAPDDRIMVEFLQDAGESPAIAGNLAPTCWQYCGGERIENGKISGKG